MGTFTLLIILAGIAYGTFRIYSSLERHLLEIERQLGDIRDELKGAKSAMIMDTQGDIRDEPKDAKSAMIMDTQSEAKAIPDAFAEVARPSSIEKLSSTAGDHPQLVKYLT